jgi:hypothetical protein
MQLLCMIPYSQVTLPPSPAAFLVDRGKNVKTIQGLLRHANVTTTPVLYSQAIDGAELEAQEDIALAITSTAAEDWPDYIEENLRGAIFRSSHAGRMRSQRPIDLISASGLPVIREGSRQIV